MTDSVKTLNERAKRLTAILDSMEAEANEGIKSYDFADAESRAHPKFVLRDQKRIIALIQLVRKWDVLAECERILNESK